MCQNLETRTKNQPQAFSITMDDMVLSKVVCGGIPELWCFVVSGTPSQLAWDVQI